MEGRLDVETSNRPCGRISRSLAFAAMRKGEARMRRSKGPKPLRRTPLSDSPARRETPTVLNPSNRRIRTRTYGGVGGEESRDSPLSRFPEKKFSNDRPRRTGYPAFAGYDGRRRRKPYSSSSCFLPPIVFSLANTASTLRSSSVFSPGSNSDSFLVVSEAGSSVAPP